MNSSKVIRPNFLTSNDISWSVASGLVSASFRGNSLDPTVFDLGGNPGATGTRNASIVAGAIPAVFTTTSEFDYIEPGTDGQVLTSNGAGSLPTYQDAGASALDDLSDVDTSTTAPTAGQALVWNATDSEWVPRTIGGGFTSINGADDVNIVSVADNQVLQYNSATGHWVNRMSSQIVDDTPLSTHNDVVTTAPTDNQVLTWDATASMWEPQDPAGAGTTFDVWQVENSVAIAVPNTNTAQALTFNTGTPDFTFGTNFVTVNVGANTMSIPAGNYKFTMSVRCDQPTNAITNGRGYFRSRVTVGTQNFDSGVEYIRYRAPHQGTTNNISFFVNTTAAATNFSATSTLQVEASNVGVNVPIGGARLIIERLS